MEIQNKTFYDTSALLADCPLKLSSLISTVVLEELENIKTSYAKDDRIKYKARALVRRLMSEDANLWELPDISYKKVKRYIKIHSLENNNDSYIIAEAILYAQKHKQKVQFITADACQYLIAQSYPKYLIVQYYSDTSKIENLWTGYKDLYLNDEELATLYDNPDTNTLGLEVNEYAIIHNNGNVVDWIKWDGEKNEIIKYSRQKSDYFGDVQPLNDQQKLFFDLLQNRKIPVKLARGQFGSGKTFLALVHAMNYINKYHKFDKIVYVRNNVEVAGSQRLGALPGEQEEKLMPWLMPLADILGDEEALRQAIENKEIEPIHLGYIRGRSFINSIIFVDEAENLTTDNVKLIIARAGKGSEVWFLGDESQTDSDIFRKNSGIASLVNSLKGDPMFGTIELQKSERSAVAQLAAKIHGES